MVCATCFSATKPSSDFHNDSGGKPPAPPIIFTTESTENTEIGTEIKYQEEYIRTFLRTDMLEMESSKLVDFSDRPEDALTKSIIAGAIEVHRILGPGLLESTYEACLIFELQRIGLDVESQKSLPITYKGIQLDCGYRLDIVVNGSVIVEVKAIESILPIHHAQLLTYLKMSKCRVGLLLNFNVKILKEGIRRFIS